MYGFCPGYPYQWSFCVFRYYGTKCTGCGQGIPANELVMRAVGNVYHLPCFVCAVCGHQLQKGDQYVFKDGQLFCRLDFEKEFALMALPPKNEWCPAFSPKCKDELTDSGKGMLSFGLLCRYWDRRFCNILSRRLSCQIDGLSVAIIVPTDIYRNRNNDEKFQWWQRKYRDLFFLTPWKTEICIFILLLIIRNQVCVQSGKIAIKPFGYNCPKWFNNMSSTLSLMRAVHKHLIRNVIHSIWIHSVCGSNFPQFPMVDHPKSVVSWVLFSCCKITQNRPESANMCWLNVAKGANTLLIFDQHSLHV